MNRQMTGKTVLITGGTGGIGQASAIGIARLGARVIVTGRNRTRGEQGVTDIKAASGNNDVHLLLADMSSMDEVRQMAATFQQRFQQLDVLVNNVGHLTDKRRETVDGHEMSLAVNHLAPFVLTHELLSLLKQSDDARIINITGGMPGQGGIDFENLQAEKSFLGLTTYTHAKNIMMAASYEFAKRLEDTGVKLVVAYPGAAQTNMTSSITTDMVPFYMRLLWPVMKVAATVFMNGDPASAAVSTIHLASTSPENITNGAYYDMKGKQTNWPAKLIQPDVTARIWEISQQLVNQQTTGSRHHDAVKSAYR